MSIDDTSHAEERPTREIEVTVNGDVVTREIEPRRKLSDFLRRDCGCRGVRVGCEHGVCGACTVELDGDIVKSCLLYAVQAEDLAVETVEGLSQDGQLHPIQEAFHESHALQCGFCTSGFVMATKALLEDEPDPDRDDVEKAFADNICRCTGYQNIYEAVDRAAEKLDEGDHSLGRDYPRGDGEGGHDVSDGGGVGGVGGDGEGGA